MERGDLATGKAFVAAVQQIENNGLRHDRHPDRADLKTAPLLRQPRHHATGRIQPEGRTARQSNRVDPLHRHVGFQQSRIARAGRAAHDRNRRNGRIFEQNDADAGGNRVIVRLTKIDTGHIGYQIAHGPVCKGSGVLASQVWY